jgi:hypothetical protein
MQNQEMIYKVFFREKLNGKMGTISINKAANTGNSYFHIISS